MRNIQIKGILNFQSPEQIIELNLVPEDINKVVHCSPCILKNGHKALILPLT